MTLSRCSIDWARQAADVRALRKPTRAVVGRPPVVPGRHLRLLARHLLRRRHSNKLLLVVAEASRRPEALLPALPRGRRRVTESCAHNTSHQRLAHSAVVAACERGHNTRRLLLLAAGE